MVCFQVMAQFTFYQHRPTLVSSHIKKQEAKPLLVLSGLPFRHGLKYSRFFHTKKEASDYVAYLHKVYADRIIPNPRPKLAHEILSVSRQEMPHGAGLKKGRSTGLIYQAPLPGGQLYLFQEGLK
jgi:hypothetical protein